MEPPPPPPPQPSSCCSESAAAALGHLRGVEKQLRNEGLVFNKQTVEYFEDAIKAIKELEEERRHTIELLEEETIKNCSLRVRIKGFPEIVMKEFEELVAAARRFHFQKLSEIKISVSEALSAVESTYSRQELSEEENVTLCQEEAELWTKHQEIVELVNQQLSEKHTVNIEINQLYNLKRNEEEEIVRQESAIQELKTIMATEAIEFREKKHMLDAQIEELRRQLEAKRQETADKRDEYLELLPELEDLEKKIEEYNQIISGWRHELGEVFKKIKKLIKDFEEKKAQKEKILGKKSHLQNKVTNLDEGFNDEREDLLRKIKEAEEQLEVAKRCYEKLKNENDLLNTQLEAFTEEEERCCGERDMLAEEFEYLSNLLTEKLDNVAKRLVETKTIEEELERQQEVFDTSQNTYANEISLLEVTLKKESERRIMLQNQLNDITVLYQKLMADHEALLNSSKEKSEAAKKQLNDLTAQNEKLNKQIRKYEEMIKLLTVKLCNKQVEYEKRDATLEAEIKNLEASYHAKIKRLQEMEEELKVNLPLSEEMATEFEEASTGYTNQQDLYTELLEEQRTLNKAIERSIREISRLKRQKFQAKNEIKKNREMAFDLLKQFTGSLKFIERDNYEMDRQLDLLHGENARLRAGIAYLKEDISTIENEIKVYQSERQNLQKARRYLYDLFIKKWIKDEHLHKMFLKYQNDIMKILEEFIRRNRRRNYKVDYVHDGLQLKYDEMESLLESKSTKASAQGNLQMLKTTTVFQVHGHQTA